MNDALTKRFPSTHKSFAPDPEPTGRPPDFPAPASNAEFDPGSPSDAGSLDDPMVVRETHEFLRSDDGTRYDMSGRAEWTRAFLLSNADSDFDADSFSDAGSYLSSAKSHCDPDPDPD